MNRDADPTFAARVALEVVALAEAVARMEEPARRILSEKLSGLLVETQPGTARIAASLLVSAGDAFGRELGVRTLSRLADDPRVDFAREDALYRERQAQSASAPRAVDVIVLAVKEVELIACLRAFGVASGSRPSVMPGGLEVYFLESDGLSIALAWVGTDGNVESAMKSAALFAILGARLAVLVGMAAGVVGKMELGDVAVSEAVWAADFEVLKKKGSIPKPKTYPVAGRVLTGLTAMRNIDPFWGARVSDEVRKWATLEPELCTLPEDLPEDWRPKFKTGVIFAGSRIVQDGSLPRKRQEQHERLIAAEMEGAGFAAACDERRASLDWVVIRGVADFGKTPRPKDWQFVSTYAAAALLRDGLRLERFGLRDA